MLAYKKDLGNDEKKRKEEEQGVAVQPEKSANDLMLGGLAGVAQALKVDIPQPVGKGATQKQVAKGYQTVRAALTPQEQQMLDNSAQGFAFHALKKSAPAIPTAAQTNAATKLWLNEPMEKADREEFLKAPWMIGAVNGMIGGFENQAQAFEKNAVKRQQERLNKRLSQAQERAQDQGLDPVLRREAALEAEDIQKQLTAAENELYRLNGGKHYAKVDIGKTLATLSGQQGVLGAVDQGLQTKVVWKGHKSKDIDDGLALMFQGKGEEMTPQQRSAVEAFVQENGAFFKPEALSFFYDLVYPDLARQLNLAANGGDPWMVSLADLNTIYNSSQKWAGAGDVNATEAALLAKVMDERVPLEDKGKYLRQMAELRSRGEGAYETEAGKRYLKTVEKEMAAYAQAWEDEKALDATMKIYGLSNALTKLQAGEELSEEDQEYLDDFYYTQLTQGDLRDEAYTTAIEGIRKAEINYWDIENGIEPTGSYDAWNHSAKVRALAERYLQMDVMVAKSCGLTYTQLLEICPEMAWDMDDLYARAVKEFDEAWGEGGSPRDWITQGLEIIADGAGATLHNEGLGFGNSIWLGGETGVGEWVQGPLDFNAMILCPPMSSQEMKHYLEHKYLIPYGPIKGRELLRQRMEEMAEQLQDERLKAYVKDQLESCTDVFLADFNEEHLQALEAAYQNQKWVEGNIRKAMDYCTPAEYILAFGLARNAITDLPEALLTKGVGKAAKAVGLKGAGTLVMQFVGRALLNGVTVVPTHMRESYQVGDLDLTTEEFSAIVQGTLDAALDTVGDVVMNDLIGDKAQVFSKVGKRYIIDLAENSPLTRGFMTDTIEAAARLGDAILDEWYVSKNKDELFESIGGQLEEILLLNSGKEAFERGEKEALLAVMLSPQSRQLEVYMMCRGGGQWPLVGITLEELQAGVAQYVMQDEYYASEEALAIAREVDELEEKAKGVAEGKEDSGKKGKQATKHFK